MSDEIDSSTHINTETFQSVVHFINSKKLNIILHFTSLNFTTPTTEKESRYLLLVETILIVFVLYS